MKRALLATLPAFYLASASAQTPHGIVVLDEWGVFSAKSDHQVAEPNATSGHSTVSRDVHLIERTHEVCAQLGTHFGIRYHLRDDVPASFIDLDVDVHHPPMMNTRGAMQTDDEIVRHIPAHASWYSGWTFSDPHELITGTWHIIVRRAGAVEIDAVFDVHTGCAAPLS